MAVFLVFQCFNVNVEFSKIFENCCKIMGFEELLTKAFNSKDFLKKSRKGVQSAEIFANTFWA